MPLKGSNFSDAISNILSTITGIHTNEAAGQERGDCPPRGLHADLPLPLQK